LLSAISYLQFCVSSQASQQTLSQPSALTFSNPCASASIRGSSAHFCFLLSASPFSFLFSAFCFLLSAFRFFRLPFFRSQVSSLTPQTAFCFLLSAFALRFRFQVSSLRLSLNHLNQLGQNRLPPIRLAQSRDFPANQCRTLISNPTDDFDNRLDISVRCKTDVFRAFVNSWIR